MTAHQVQLFVHSEPGCLLVTRCQFILSSRPYYLYCYYQGWGQIHCQTTNANTNTFISRWPNTNYTNKNTTTFRLSNTNTNTLVKYQYKFQNVNLFCNIHPMIMLLTNYTTYYVKLCFNFYYCKFASFDCKSRQAYGML